LQFLDVTIQIDLPYLQDDATVLREMIRQLKSKTKKFYFVGSLKKLSFEDLYQVLYRLAAIDFDVGAVTN
jgi:hypothetical protein